MSATVSCFALASSSPPKVLVSSRAKTRPGLICRWRASESHASDTDTITSAVQADGCCCVKKLLLRARRTRAFGRCVRVMLASFVPARNREGLMLFHEPLSIAW
jgi:hypothetical protein